MIQMMLEKRGEEARIEGIEIGKARGRNSARMELAEDMLRNNEPMSKIELYTKLAADRITEIANAINVPIVAG